MSDETNTRGRVRGFASRATQWFSNREARFRLDEIDEEIVRLSRERREILARHPEVAWRHGKGSS